MRRNFTKLRISGHKLAIETGRHSGTPREERKCTLCNLKEVETEFHFLLTCPFFNHDRETLQNRLYAFSNIKIEPTESIFKLIISGFNGDLELSLIICDYINTCFEKRNTSVLNKKQIENVNIVITRSGRVSKRPSILSL